MAPLKGIIATIESVLVVGLSGSKVWVRKSDSGNSLEFGTVGGRRR